MDLMEPWDPLDHPPRIEIRKQDSDDSDAEGGLGNVTRVVLRPPGHSGKAKRGHLSFDASYETGNLGRVDFISEFEYDLFIRPDTCNPRYRLWFNFVVDNARCDQRVIFNIVNISKTRLLFSNGMTPLVKTSSRPRWQRIGSKYVYYHKSPEHRNHYILSFAFLFDREEDVYQFAFTFPYSFSRAQAHIDLILQKNLSFISVQTLAVSLQNRKVDVITIGNPALFSKKTKTIVIMARIHPGDSPTSFIIQGLLDFLMSSHTLAVVIRDYIVIKVIPMINPDGVFVGNYKTSLMGYDLNRHWNNISTWSHPVLSALKNYLLDLDASRMVDLDMILDLHSNASLLGTFIYGNSYEDVYRFERHILFPKLLSHNAEDYNPCYTIYNRDPIKAGTARRNLCDTLRSGVNTYSLEVSSFAYVGHGGKVIPYTEDSYFRLGRNLVRTLGEYYRVTGVIPPSVLPPPFQPPSGEEEEGRRKIIRRSRSHSRQPELNLGRGEGAEEERGEKIRGISNAKLSERVEEGGETDDEDSDSLSRPEENRWSETEKSLKARDEYRHQKFNYQTFDFSPLSPVLARRGELECSSYGGRKVGGGGIVGRKKNKKLLTRSKLNEIKWGNKNEPYLPSLTIIDFNLLIRLGLERRLESTDSNDKNRRDNAEIKHRRRRSNKREKVRFRGGYLTDISAWDDSSDSDGFYYSQRNATHSDSSITAGLWNEKIKLIPRNKSNLSKKL